MRKVRTFIAFIALAGIIYAVTQIDYKDLSWHVNNSNYLTIISMTFVLLGMIYSNIYEAKKRRK